MAPYSPVRYSVVEEFRGDGNAGDYDELIVEGRTHNVFGTTNYDDVFMIGLSAAGTSADPLLTLQDGANVFFRLLNFLGLFRATVDGLAGEYGGTMLPALRRMNSSPGSVCVSKLGSMRESEHVMNSACGFWPSTRR